MCENRSSIRWNSRVHLLPSIYFTAPVFHLDTSWLNARAWWNTAREGATKKRKTNPPQTTTKSTVSKIQNKRTKRVRIVIRWNSSCRIITYTSTEGVATEREREYTLTLIHICHRPRIPFGHVLIERMCFFKHWKREGCNKRQKYHNRVPKTDKK